MGICFLGGCFSKPIEFEPGWATRHIEGIMEDSRGQEFGKEAFIIVLEYYSSFINLSDEPPIFIPHARLVRPSKEGRYRIQFDLRASVIETIFIAPGHLMERFRFQRQMGIGKLRYHARMKHEPNWKGHLILEVSPFLENFILEPRYKLEPIHQFFIGEWLDQERENVQD